MRFPGLRFFASAFDGFPCLGSYGLAGLPGFLSDGLSSLLGFLPDGFGCLLRFVTYRFQSVLDGFACFLRVVLYFLTYSFLAKNGQHGGCNQRHNQAYHSHVLLLSLHDRPC